MGKPDQLPTAIASEVAEHRDAGHPVHPLFLNRWSSRSYAKRPVAEETLLTVLEAARWAPSSSNQQPWRFIVARTPEDRERFASFIKPNNRLWTDRAPVLVLIASDTLKQDGDKNAAHAFDAGAAWASIAFQANLLGLSSRAVGGYDRELAREVLRVPDHIELHAIITLGYRGDKEDLHESFRDKEKPNGRKPLRDSIREGTYA